MIVPMTLFRFSLALMIPRSVTFEASDDTGDSVDADEYPDATQEQYESFLHYAILSFFAADLRRVRPEI